MKIKLKGNISGIIRMATVEDASSILALVKKVMSEVDYFPSTSEEFTITVEQEEKYLEKIALFLVAEIDGKIVGAASLERSKYLKMKHSAMFGITILKEYSGIGLGSLLVEQVINWSQENDIEKIDLEVFEENRPAIRLYKKFDFIIEGRKNKHIKTNGVYQDSLLMTKFL